MCTARNPIVRDYARRARACKLVFFCGINFGDLHVVKNLPIRQIKIPAKVSGYMVSKFMSLNRSYVYT